RKAHAYQVKASSTQLRMLPEAMSKRADTIILRLARPEEHAELEQLQAHASLELPEYREQLLHDPQAIHLPPAQIANGQVIIAEFNGQIAGFAAVVAGE